MQHQRPYDDAFVKLPQTYHRNKIPSEAPHKFSRMAYILSGRGDLEMSAVRLTQERYSPTTLPITLAADALKRRHPMRL